MVKLLYLSFLLSLTAADISIGHGQDGTYHLISWSYSPNCTSNYTTVFHWSPINSTSYNQTYKGAVFNHTTNTVTLTNCTEETTCWKELTKGVNVTRRYVFKVSGGENCTLLSTHNVQSVMYTQGKDVQLRGPLNYTSGLWKKGDQVIVSFNATNYTIAAAYEESVNYNATFNTVTLLSAKPENEGLYVMTTPDNSSADTYFELRSSSRVSNGQVVKPNPSESPDAPPSTDDFNKLQFIIILAVAGGITLIVLLISTAIYYRSVLCQRPEIPEEGTTNQFLDVDVSPVDDNIDDLLELHKRLSTEIEVTRL